jgi:hypothetical protein
MMENAVAHSGADYTRGRFERRFVAGEPEE